MVMLTTSDSAQKVIEFYRAAFKKAGIMDVKSNSATVNGAVTGMIGGQTADEKRSAQVTVTTSDGKTNAAITYEGKK
jgi:hypothetical protein